MFDVGLVGNQRDRLETVYRADDLQGSQIPIVDLELVRIDQEDRHVETLHTLWIHMIFDDLQKHSRVFQVGNLLYDALAGRVQARLYLFHDFGQVLLELFGAQECRLDLERAQIACQLLNHRFVAARVRVLIEYEAYVKYILVAIVLGMIDVDRKTAYFKLID